MDETLKSIGISPRERLERIEAVLERIDNKLDGKADQSTVVAMEVRLKAVEACIERGEDLKIRYAELNAVFKELHADHEQLRNRMAYYFGGIAAIAVAAELFFAHLIG